MDKVVINTATYEFICEWMNKNGVIIEHVPEVLSKYKLIWENAVENTDAYTEYECEWLSEREVHISVKLHYASNQKRKPLKTSFRVDFDYTATALSNLLKEMGQIDGISSVEEYLDNSRGFTHVNFPVGVSCDNETGEFPEANYSDGQQHSLSEFAQSIAYVHIYLMYFMANYQPDMVHYTSQQRESRPNKKNKSGAAKTQLVTTIHLTKFVQDVESGEKKLPRHNKKCQYAFGVKGHPRHYRDKDGNIVKTVWIKPYQKNTSEQRRKRQRTYKFDMNMGVRKK